MPSTLTITETMDILKCSRSYVEKLMYSGKLIYYKPTKRHVLIDADSLSKLLRPY
ncbi:helix-turn-helix domain-containing protein [Bifidobacterium crudilactis]|uniref:helix-turn-helix domain-containing protein n=1 Tax=Bifidobacterium crudilactis TaxID=327277 RepID=UPI003D81147D